jgi:hypothetical protein
MRQYLNAALSYALLGLASGVFNREFAKILGFSGSTRLSLMHVHYLSLGLFFFLLLLVLEKQFEWSSLPKSKGVVMAYHVGLNVTGLGFFVRGVLEVLELPISKGLNASIAGVSGVGHILIAVSLVLILLRVKTKIVA